MTNNWSKESIFYHIYPLGMLGALYKNDYKANPISRLNELNSWIDYLKEFKINAVYIGPLFESEYHGYETVDYYMVDRRLGTNENLKALVSNLHKNSIKIILDGVFNHCGRDFWAFKELLKNKNNSTYKDWFHGVDFNKNNIYNDGFSYNGWNGHINLVKFNLKNSGIKDYLLNAVENWIKYFDIDGLRLDAADSIDIDFLKILSSHCKNIKNDFWLMGEIVHGNYNTWANPSTLDSTTNYELYKGLYSSHNDNNYFEIAYSLKRQFSENGIYKNLFLYNFTDNHDVNRVASVLKNKANLYPLYILLFTIPGIPSIYYGSEFGTKGIKANNSDDNLRPCISAQNLYNSTANNDLFNAIKKLSVIHSNYPALKYGIYEELAVSHNYFAFKRKHENQTIIIIANSSNKMIDLELKNITGGNKLKDILNNNELFHLDNGKVKINLYPYWGRIMLAE